jgi:hypothetical protein
MPADIAQVVGTTAAKGKGPGVPELLDIYFVKSGINIILHPEYGRSKKVIVFYQFTKSNRVYLLAPPDHFIGAVSINMF